MSIMDYQKLRQSLQRLDSQHRYLESGEYSDLPALAREAIPESVIQRFEVCFDMLWKHLKRHLIEMEGLSAEDMPKC